jgi:hypothetical protein
VTSSTSIKAVGRFELDTIKLSTFVRALTQLAVIHIFETLCTRLIYPVHLYCACAVDHVTEIARWTACQDLITQMCRGAHAKCKREKVENTWSRGQLVLDSFDSCDAWRKAVSRFLFDSIMYQDCGDDSTFDGFVGKHFQFRA